jgi:hypothetical protein
MERCAAGSLAGDTTPYSNNYDPGTGGCSSGYPEGGNDATYVVDLQVGDVVDMTYTQLNLDAAFYLVTDCSNVPGSCVAGADDTVTGQPETIHYVVPATGTYYLILDSYTTGGGPWTLDYSFQCPIPQACCFSDGHCEMQMPDVCRQMGGTPQGNGTTCDQSFCYIPEGACCTADGSCFITGPAGCEQEGEHWMGNGTSCDPNPCLPVPTVSTTWGRIKGSYH